MKLGILLDRFDPRGGGAEAHTAALVRHARDRGTSVGVALLAGSAPAGATAVRIRAPRRRPARDRSFAARGLAALRDGGSDVVLGFRHCPGVDVYLPHGGLLGDAVRAWERARGGPSLLRRVARVLSGKTRWFLEAERQLLGEAAGPRVIAVSHRLAARIAAVWPAAAHRTVVLPNGADLDRLPPRDPTALRADLRRRLALPDAAYVGLLLAHHPRLKGVAVAVEAMAMPGVRALAPPFHLLVAGGRVPVDVRRRARRLGVAARLHDLGFQADPRPLLGAADVLVHASFHDPCSLACLEALALGVPVVTTPENGVAELMGARGGIVLEAAGDAGALATALAVLADPGLRRATALDAREVAERHPLAAQLEAILDVCRAAAASG